MLKWIKGLSILNRTALYSAAFSVLLFILLIPLFFFSWGEIPCGILLGGLSGSLCFFLFGLTDRIKRPHDGMVVTILLIIAMSVIHILVLVLAAVLYYHFQVHAFNVFSTFGSIFVALIVYVILNLFPERKVPYCG